MSGLRSASAWNTRASMYMPVPAMIHAMTAPSGPVALANVRGSEKMPAPTIPPTTIAVSCIRDIFCSADAMSFPPSKFVRTPILPVRIQATHLADAP